MLRTSRRLLCTAENAGSLGAYGKRGTRGSGKSLMGSKLRGQGALSKEDKAAMAAGDLGQDGDHDIDDTLEAGDVLMEVLAEDFRHRRTVEYDRKEDDTGEVITDAERQRQAAEEAKASLPPPRGPRLAQRAYLSHPGVGSGNQYQRQQMAARQKLEAAESAAFNYAMPAEAKAQREHDRRSRARLREHDVIENRIQEAMATGAFDDLPGRGKPLPVNDNVFEAISGEAMAHRILKNAGCAPGWVELGKDIRQMKLNMRANLALGWSDCAPVWPPPPEPVSPLPAEEKASSIDVKVAPKAAGGGWRAYQVPGPLQQATRDDELNGVRHGEDASQASEAPNTAATGATREASTNVPSPAPSDTPSEAQPEAAAEAAAQELAHAVRVAAERGPCPTEWREVLDTFGEEVRSVNKSIDSYNLSVPASWMGVQRLNLSKELERALREAPQRATSLKTERRAKLARGNLGGGTRNGTDGGVRLSVGGTAPEFALHSGPTFPSVFDAVRAALFSR